MTVKLLFFAGSAREDSLNKKLARAAQRYAAGKPGVDATFIDLKDFPMPLYDGDLEAASGLPDAAVKLKKIMAEHDGFLIASPEHNGSFTALLKNALDWVSRGGTTPHDPYDGKVVALTAASPGGLGGLRGLVHLRAVLGGNSSLRCLVLPNQMAVPFADKAFDAAGNLADEKQAAMLHATIDRLAEVAGALKK